MLIADASNWTAAAGTLLLGVVTGIALLQTRTHARRASQPHVVPLFTPDGPPASGALTLVNDGQGLARNARLALRLGGDGRHVVRSTFTAIAPGESKDVELVSSAPVAWRDATGCVLAEDLGGDEWVVPFAILEEHSGANPRLYVSAGRISRARRLDAETRDLVHYLRQATLDYKPPQHRSRWRRAARRRLGG